LFVNLASNEYFSAVDTKELKVAVVTPDFKDYKDGKLKIAFMPRKQGHDGALYHRYRCKTINDLQGFNYGGYQFDATLSAGNHLVFTR
jgi:cytoplasmic iron level regulating protein YaaA (DUF328/UPF0246 family)